MNAGEPPDETGESEGEDTPTDGERDGANPGDDGPESSDSEAADGEGTEVVDPAEEVEAAVADVMGSAGLDDEEHERDEIDESTAAAAAQELADSVATEDPAAAESGDETADATEVDSPTDADAAEGEATSDSAATQAGADGADAPDPDSAEEGDDAHEDEAVTAPTEDAPADGESFPDDEPREAVPEDVRKYDRFKKIDGGTYDRANEFLRDRTYITAREWAMARLCADFRTETGVEMTKIGNNLPELVPFMTDTYTPQAVNQARAAFEEKVRKAGATFLYGAMCDFFTAEELDDVMYEATEVAKFLLEVEGVELSVDEELAAEDHISEVMRDVREHSAALRHDEVTCPECGHEIGGDD